jgi:hypothetical protein
VKRRNQCSSFGIQGNASGRSIEWVGVTKDISVFAQLSKVAVEGAVLLRENDDVPYAT